MLYPRRAPLGAANDDKDKLTDMMAELKSLAARHGREGETLRRLPPALAEAFHRHDIYRLILPVDLGGAGVGPVAFLTMIQELAAVDGPVAWNFAIGAGSGLYGGYIPLEQSRSMFADPACCIAGAYAPFGRGEAVPGGYRIAGRWGWASGVDQARWMVFGFSVARAGDGPPEVRQGLAPCEAFRVLDTWHVSGMRGTGSTEYEVEDLFVPAEMTFRMFIDPPRHPAAIFRLPGAFFGACVAAVPLGIARSAVTGLTRLATAKRSFPGRSALSEQGFAQYAVAKAEALAESGSLYLHQAIDEIWQKVQAGEASDIALRARARRACVQAAEASAEAVDLCCRAAGGHALFESQPFERALRDVRAAIAQITLQRSTMEDAGRAAFGMSPLSATF